MSCKKRANTFTLNVHLHFYDIFLSKFKPEFIHF